MTEVQELLDKAREAVDLRQVFGEPFERAGATIIPVARVVTGGGTGRGMEGTGGGYGVIADPVGAYVIRDGKVKWEPAVNVNKIISGGLIVGALAILSVPRILRGVGKMQKIQRRR